MSVESDIITPLPNSFSKSTAAFELSRVTLRGQQRPRLDSVSLTIPWGATAVIGYSGAGKTSLLNLLAGFEQPDQGTLRNLFRDPVSNIRDQGRLALFWAPSGGGYWPHMTVREHLEVVSSDENSCQSGKSTDEILTALDLDHRRQAVPGDLSQGERSRLAVARALASGAAVLLLDEPLAHVDGVRKPQYWQLIREMVQQNGTALIFATHEAEVAIRDSEFVVCLDSGRVIYQGQTRSLYCSPPDQICGEFLGRLNWLEPPDAAFWFAQYRSGSVDNQALVLRPEQVTVERVTEEKGAEEFEQDTELQVVSSVFSGSVSETIVRAHRADRQIRLIHRSGRSVLSAGDRVRVDLR